MKAAAVGVVAGVAVMVVAWPAVGRALDRLTEARTDYARSLALAEAPPARAIVTPGIGLAARDAATATAELTTRIRALAGKGGVLAEEVRAIPDGGLARVRLRVSGSEDAVIAFADALERGRPLVRFTTWSIAADGGTVRLSGEAVAPWG